MSDDDWREVIEEKCIQARVAVAFLVFDIALDL